MKKLFTALLLLGVLSVFTWAQPANQSLVLEFVDGTEFSVTNPEGAQFFYAKGGILEGDTIPIGSIVSTGLNTQAVLKLKPNGTVIKLAKNTTFKIDLLATATGGKNTFTLVLGKVRTIAATGSNYEIKTGTTVCGVRGTDFIFSYEEGKKALLMVAEGIVEFTGLATGASIMVGKGQFADFYSSFAPQFFNEEMFNEEYGDMGVPVSTLPPEKQEEIKKAEEQPAKPAEQPAPAQAAVTEPSEEEKPQEPEPQKEPAVESAFVSWLKDVLGMELGSLTINDTTWSKVVIQPTITIGKLKTALYLPIIYDKNLFDPVDWYHPNGQDEWSFGFDIGWQEHTWEAFLDALTDLSLKIKYIEYGSQLDDPFFLKVGNLRSFTIGHGLIMRNYANDADFPAVRKIGFNIGLKNEQLGFEFLTNELANPEILGTRFFVMPVKGSKFALGASLVADLAPARVFNTDIAPSAANDYGNPIFMGLGADIDFPILPPGLFGLRFFADVAAMVPYVRNDFTWEGNPVTAGFKMELLFDESGIKNWGFASGFMGNILFANYRLEFRYFNGVFRPSFFDTGYERKRSSYVTEYAGYLSGTTPINTAPSVVGIYGEGGASLFNDKLSLSFGYFWPWPADAFTLADIAANNDFFQAKLTVKKGVIPVINVYGSIIYERKHFAPSLINGEGLMLFDENTVFGGELIVPIPGSPFLSLALVVSTTVAHDDNGNVIYQAANPSSPVILPVVMIETRLQF